MTDYVKTARLEEYNDVAVWFYNEHEKPLALGKKLYALNPNAYMNGYNWEAVFTYYLRRHAPDLLEDLEQDPEAGSYAAYYPLTPENEATAERFASIIVSLVEGEEELCRLVQEADADIQWD